MDWSNPLRTIAPTVDADVLQVLARTHEPVTGNQLAGLASRSYAQVHAVVGRLVSHGLVSMRQHGRTYTYVLNRDHTMSGAIQDLLEAPNAVNTTIETAVSTWTIPPISIAMFGSAARREASADSDVDLLVVRVAAVAEDDPAWSEPVGSLARQVEKSTGNRAHIVELSESELWDAVLHDEPLIESLRMEARTIIGEDIRNLITQARTT
ncbi:MAG: nucleotidyltransferase domain-containing protein [Acidimicrobiia bacterium]